MDSQLTAVVDATMLKVVAWYDNEWGYSNRLVGPRRRGSSEVGSVGGAAEMPQESTSADGEPLKRAPGATDLRPRVARR